MIKTMRTNIFKRLLMAAGIGMNILISHKHTPKTTITAIKFINSLINILIFGQYLIIAYYKLNFSQFVKVTKVEITTMN